MRNNERRGDFHAYGSARDAWDEKARAAKACHVARSIPKHKDSMAMWVVSNMKRVLMDVGQGGVSELKGLVRHTSVSNHKNGRQGDLMADDGVRNSIDQALVVALMVRASCRKYDQHVVGRKSRWKGGVDGAKDGRYTKAAGVDCGIWNSWDCPIGTLDCLIEYCYNRE